MVKLFISHSSKQKEFAETLVEEVGIDCCILDAYDFSPAYKTMQEIVEKIGQSGIFVFLVSKESLESDWCATEVSLARNHINSGRLKGFYPYIIDDSSTFHSVPEWIKSKDTYNLKYFRSPKLVAHDLSLKIRRFENEKGIQAYKIAGVYEGRQPLFQEFEDKKAEKRKAKSLIVSGRVGLGRQRFSDICFAKVKGNSDFYTERISLVHPQGLPDFIVQLNSITCMYSEERLRDILSYGQECQIDSAVEMLNEIYMTQGRIEIVDERSIVDYKATIVPWFTKLLQHEGLKNRLGINVISNVHPRTAFIDPDNSLINVQMSDLTRKERFNILTSYLEAMDYSDYEEMDIWDACDKLVQTVSQLVNYAKIIKSKGIVQARRELESIRDSCRHHISSILKPFVEDKEAMDFLALMSQIDMLSYQDIKNIYGDRYENILKSVNLMIDNGLVLEFSSAHTLIRIDSAVKDHFERIKARPSKKLRGRFKIFIEDSYQTGAKLTEEPSLYYARCNDQLNSGKLKDTESILIPSIVIRYIINLYNSGNKDQQVSDLCRQIIDSHSPSVTNAGLIDEVLFWLCLSLAKLGDEKNFYRYINLVTDKVSNNFLRGFYYRHQNNNDRALEYFEKVLAKAPNMNMACREKVGVLIHLKRYDDALELAESNYHRHPENTYHIDAYYKCLLKKRNQSSDDRKMLDQLEEEAFHVWVNGNLHPLQDGLRIQRKVRSAGINRDEIYSEIREMRNTYSGIKYIQETLSDCEKYLNG